MTNTEERKQRWITASLKQIKKLGLYAEDGMSFQECCDVAD